MKISISFLFLILLAALPLTVAAAEPEVIYWNSDAGKALRARIAPDEDYWQLIPWFTEQQAGKDVVLISFALSLHKNEAIKLLKFLAGDDPQTIKELGQVKGIKPARGN